MCLYNHVFTDVPSAALVIWAEVLGKNKLAAGLIIPDVTSHACAFTAFKIIISYILFNIESQLFNIDLLSHYRWWRVESIPFSWAFILFFYFIFLFYFFSYFFIFIIMLNSVRYLKQQEQKLIKPVHVSAFPI